jgi:hypothetical protein
MRHPLRIALLLLLTSPAALAAEIPRLAIEATCRAAPRLEAGDPDPYQSCMRDEQAARSELEQQWASFNPQHRETCVEQTRVGGSPSYVDVLTCLQMYAGTPVTRPARRPRGG